MGVREDQALAQLAEENEVNLWCLLHDSELLIDSFNLTNGNLEITFDLGYPKFDESAPANVNCLIVSPIAITFSRWDGKMSGPEESLLGSNKKIRFTSNTLDDIYQAKLILGEFHKLELESYLGTLSIIATDFRFHGDGVELPLSTLLLIGERQWQKWAEKNNQS